jgi:hypothetical protein
MVGSAMNDWAGRSKILNLDPLNLETFPAGERQGQLLHFFKQILMTYHPGGHGLARVELWGQ